MCFYDLNTFTLQLWIAIISRHTNLYCIASTMWVFMRHQSSLLWRGHITFKLVFYVISLIFLCWCCFQVRVYCYFHKMQSWSIHIMSHLNFFFNFQLYHLQNPDDKEIQSCKEARISLMIYINITINLSYTIKPFATIRINMVF
jgi:hypothetical protein